MFAQGWINSVSRSSRYIYICCYSDVRLTLGDEGVVKALSREATFMEIFIGVLKNVVSRYIDLYICGVYIDRRPIRYIDVLPCIPSHYPM